MLYDAVILDVDGVLTRTAPQHERAWKALLDPLLEARDARPFTHADYLEHVDGKPREAGIRDLLASRGLSLGARERARLARDKNARFHEVLAAEGVEPYADAVQQLWLWRQHGLAIAFVSSSRNAADVLEAAGLTRFCDALVDGCDLAAFELDGKPAPDLFLEAARRLDVEPARAVVVEDAVAGVEAGARGAFGCVVGLARGGDADHAGRLRDAGAERVIETLDALGDDLVEAGTRRAQTLPSALRPGVLDAWLRGRRPVIFLDFDGTLSQLVDDPADATLDEALRPILRGLAARCTVAIVSGRDRQDVKRRVGLDGDAWYAGSHGFDISGPGGRHFEHQGGRQALPELDRAERQARDALADLDGVIVERKRFGLALHHRMADAAVVPEVARCARALADACPHLRVHAGRRLFELRPDVPWSKGHAVDRLIDVLEVSRSRSRVIYIGDGHTDEDAFRRLSGRGLGVIVGAQARPTHADLRVRGPHEVAALLEQLARADQRRTRRGAWELRYDSYLPEQERLREALCTLGNGHFATRGAHEEASASAHHYPGTYLAGGYDRIATEVHGEVVVNENLVNWPSWLGLSFKPAGGPWLSLDDHEVLDYKQLLDLRQGVLRRVARVRDADGRETTIDSRRIVSMADPHLAAIAWTLTPHNWSGPLELRASLDGTVQNQGVPRYRDLRGDHLVPLSADADSEATCHLLVRAKQSRVRVAMAARVALTSAQVEATREVMRYNDRVDQVLRLEARRDQALGLEKVVAIHSSRDPATSEPLRDARVSLARAGAFSALLKDHARAWDSLWRRCEIRLSEENLDPARVLLLHLFHLLQVASPHITDLDVSIPARGLHGEAYRGHIFWDELFILPLLNTCMPAQARAVLMYRYRRLEAARCRARARGFEGALFPWQSGSNGREESQVLHLNPASGRWLPDPSHRQYHINAAIAYNVWRHDEITGDEAFMSRCGVELLVEIARFWASIAERDPDTGRYSIRGVMGPDEFHTGYVERDAPGLDDNAYTNVMAAWCIRCAARATARLTLERRAELFARLGVSQADVHRWLAVAHRLRVVFHDDHIISQFDGYADLDELDWEGLRARHGDIQRLDRVLEAEHDTPNRYKAGKQADVLMLFYLFTADEITEQLESMGYAFDPAWIPANVAYYAQRTSHGSTLSRVVHAWVLARADRPRSWDLFLDALRSDIEDIQGGTTSEGIHLGAMAGTVDLARRAYTGAVVRDGVLWLEPRLPDALRELHMRFLVRGAWLDLSISHDALEVGFSGGDAPTARVGFEGQVRALTPGERCVFSLPDSA